MYLAYVQQRLEKDPSIGWYDGEIWFFDNYVIPLAHKLKECGVFGVSGDEYLNYAVQNRNEWAVKGREVVAAMLQRAHNKAVRLQLIQVQTVEQGTDTIIDNAELDEAIMSNFVPSTEQALLISQLTADGGDDGHHRVVIVPAGKLGLVLESTYEGTVVHEVQRGSPLEGKLFVGDEILAIDQVVVTKSMTVEAISALIQASADHERRFLVATSNAPDRISI